MTSLRAICTTRSLSVGIPRRRIRPSRLGINRSRTGSGRNVPARSSSRNLGEELLDATRFDVAASGGINAGGSVTLGCDSPATRPPPAWPDRRPGSTNHGTCARHPQMPTRAACAGSEVPAPAPPRRSGTDAPVFTGDLLPSNRAACSLDPFALQAAFPPSLVGRYSHDYYGSSATPRRQQRTVRLPQTPKGSAGTAGTLPTFTHRPVGRVGAQLYPGGIAARYRNTARDLDRPNSQPIGRDGPEQQPGPSTPTAHSRQFRGCSAYRGFQHWFVSYAFLPCYRTRPAGGGPLLDRQGLLPPSDLTSGIGLPLSFTRPLRRPGAGSLTPPGHMAPRGAVLLSDTCSHDRSRRAPASTACKAAASRRLRSVGEIPGLRTRRRRSRRVRVTPLFSGVPARRAREFGAFFLGELARCGGVQGLPSCGRDIAGAVPIPDLPAGASARQWGGVGSAPAGLGCSATRASAR